ncbi:MAG TPA: PLP-dependent aminotransferase family protein [Trebonia sp.]|jgi:DNA-binding transcriptional MocR family regulator|nr:PLP-dependent aminotransferase family protein [Trebonia sp.]
MTMPGSAGKTRIDARELTTMLGRWPAASLPSYRLLAARIGRLADAGDLPPGVMLPGERSLAAVLKVSRGTVTRAYQALCDDGRARTHPGQGTSVAPRGAGHGAPLRAHPFIADAPAADLATAASDCAPQVAGALQYPGSLPHFPERTVVTDTHGYLPLGWPALREAIAEILTAWHGIPTSAGQVLVTTGTQQALDLLARCEVLPGQTAVTEDPTYPGALDALRRAGVRTVGVPPGDPERLARAISREAGARPALAYLVPTHHNPTGLVLPAEERHQIVDLARQHPEVMFVDDMALADLPLASSRYADGPQPPPLAALVPRLPNVVTVGSFSKLYWGGLRTGWIRAPEGVIARLTAAKAAADMGGTAYQQAIVAALATGYHDEILKWRSDWLQTRYDALAAALGAHLPSWQWTPPHGGLTIWAGLPGDLCGPGGRFRDSDAFARAALDRGVAVTPGSLLSPSGAPSAHVRLAFTLPPEDLTEAVRTLAEV